MTIVTKGNTECSPRDNTPQRPIKRVGKVCTDKGTVNQCNQGFKEKFKQVWNRAFASLISVNGKHSDDGTGAITLNADDILIAGSGIAIVDNVISTTGETSVVWGAITGDITDQADLQNLFNDIDNRFAAVEIEIPALLKNAEAAVTSASQYFSRKLIFTKQDGSTFDERTTPNFHHTLGNGDDASKLEAMSRYGIKNAVFDPLQGQINDKQNTLITGQGISIVDDVISSTASAPEWGDITGNINNQTDLQNALASVLQTVYPVGSVYVNASNSANPGTIFGFGTWESLGAGRCLMGVDTSQTEFNTVGKTGGEKTHTLTVEEAPSHRHTAGSHSHSIADNGAGSVQFGPCVLEGWSNSGDPPDGCPTDGKITSSGYMWGSIQNGDGSVASTGSSNRSKWFNIGVNNHSHGGSTGHNSADTNYVGGGGSHNNLAPYITVYMWKRTA